MRNKWLPLIGGFIIINICACSSDEELFDKNSSIEDIRVNFEPIQMFEDGSTRATPVDNGTTISYLCYEDNGDALGIYSYKDMVQQGYQMSFAITGNGVKSFTFNGGGWKMLTDFDYVAYCPFVYDNKDATAIPLSYYGQEQDGDQSTAHLSNYCLMSSGKAAANSANELSLSMVFKAALCRMKLIMPDPVTLKRVAIKTANKDFILKTSYNLLADSYNAPQSEYRDDVVSMKINNLTTTQANQSVTLYMIVCPTEITSGSVDVIVEAADGSTYETSLAISKFNRGGNRISIIDANDKTKDYPITLVKTLEPIVIPNEPVDGVTGSAGDFVMAN